MYLQIKKIIEQKDGSCLIDIEYDKDVINLVKTHYKRKRISKKLIQKFIIDGLKNRIEMEKNNE